MEKLIQQILLGVVSTGLISVAGFLVYTNKSIGVQAQEIHELQEEMDTQFSDWHDYWEREALKREKETVYWRQEALHWREKYMQLQEQTLQNVVKHGSNSKEN